MLALKLGSTGKRGSLLNTVQSDGRMCRIQTYKAWYANLSAVLLALLPPHSNTISV